MSYPLESLRCQDPWGREIVLTDDVWYGKILVKRPHLADALDAVERTLRDPQQLNDDRSHPRREVYYREDLLPAPDGWSIVKVVVEFDGDQGRVVTVFPVFNVHPDERLRWIR